MIVARGQVNELAARAKSRCRHAGCRRDRCPDPRKRNAELAREGVLVEPVTRRHGELVFFPALRGIDDRRLANDWNRIELDAEIYATRGSKVTDVRCKSVGNVDRRGRAVGSEPQGLANSRHGSSESLSII